MRREKQNCGIMEHTGSNDSYEKSGCPIKDILGKCQRGNTKESKDFPASHVNTLVALVLELAENKLCCHNCQALICCVTRLQLAMPLQLLMQDTLRITTGDESLSLFSCCPQEKQHLISVLNMRQGALTIVSRSPVGWRL